MEIAAPFFQPLLLFFIDLAPPLLVRASCIHSSVRQHPLLACSFFFEIKKGAGVCVNQLILLLFNLLKSPLIALIRRLYASISLLS